MTQARDLADLLDANSKVDSSKLTSVLQQSRKNLLINGDMVVSQRGSSFTGHGAGVNYGIDRFADFHSSAGAFTISQQTSVVPAGFTHALKVQVTTADSSIAAGDRLIVFQRCEGNVVSHLKFGTSAAKTVTLSFFVRSSITGTHGGALANGSDNRNYPFTYTINAADTWERKTVTIAGDTSGTWATGTGRSLQVVWGLGVGSTYSGSAGAWASGDINSATGATTGVLGTLNSTWYLTGAQLEEGSQATEFEKVPFSEQLKECQRYFFATNYGDPDGGLSGGASFIAFDAAEAGAGHEFPVPMRAAPAITLYDNGGNANRVHRNRSGDHANDVSAILVSPNGFCGFSTTGLTVGAGYLGGVQAVSEL